MLQGIAVAVIVMTIFFDALRDGWINHPSWWRRHISKWLQLYLPIVFIMIVHLGWYWWLLLPLPCWIIWQLSLYYITGAKWESMWIRWIKRWINHGN